MGRDGQGDLTSIAHGVPHTSNLHILRSPLDCWFCKHKPLFVFIYSMIDFLTFSVLKGFKMTAKTIMWPCIKILVKKLAKG